MSLPVKRLVAALERRDRFRFEPASLESLAINTPRTSRITVHHDEWGYIPDDDRGDRRKAAFTHAAELMNARKSTEDREIVDLDVPRQSGIVCKDRVVSYLTIVGDVTIRHYPVFISEAGYASHRDRYHD